MKVSRKYKGKLMWKWAIALYVSGWALSCASITSFVAIVSDDQICETVLRFGFDAWRSIFIIMSIFITPVTLVIELIFNRIPVKFQHLLFPIGIFAIYVGVSAFVSAQMKEPLYGKNLNYRDFKPHKKAQGQQQQTSLFDWEAKYQQNEGTLMGIQRVEYCKQHFKAQSPIFLGTDESQIVEPDAIKNLITLGVMLGSLIVGHLVLFLISNYVKRDHDQPMIRKAREDI